MLESSAQEIEGSFDLKEERKIAQQQRMANASKSSVGKEGSKDAGKEEEWEDCDLESDDEDPEVIEEVDEESDGAEKTEEKGKSESTSGFVMLGQDSSKHKQTESEQFTVIDTAQNSKSWQVIGDSHSSIAGGTEHDDPSLSSFDNLKKVITGKRKGKTRQEAFQALDIEKVELLDTGELKLPNGKIIGHRQYRHIYKQKLKLPDDREQVVINKLAIEYRRMQQAINGVPKTGQVVLY